MARWGSLRGTLCGGSSAPAPSETCVPQIAHRTLLSAEEVPGAKQIAPHEGQGIFMSAHRVAGGDRLVNGKRTACARARVVVPARSNSFRAPALRERDS